LQPSCEVGRLADDRLLLRDTGSDQVADDNQPSGDADMHGELAAGSFERPDRVGERQPGPYRSLGVVLMRLRVPEID
jgi:hypothetical protein